MLIRPHPVEVLRLSKKPLRTRRCFMASNLLAMASTLRAMASNVRAFNHRSNGLEPKTSKGRCVASLCHFRSMPSCQSMCISCSWSSKFMAVEFNLQSARVASKQVSDRHRTSSRRLTRPQQKHLSSWRRSCQAGLPSLHFSPPTGENSLC